MFPGDSVVAFAGKRMKLINELKTSALIQFGLVLIFR